MESVAVAVSDKVAVSVGEAESIARMLRLEADHDRANGLKSTSALLLEEAIGIEVQVEQACNPILVRDSWRKLYELRTSLVGSSLRQPTSFRMTA